MKFIKIDTLLNMFDQPDYKGLDINKFKPGSQVYKQDLSECAIATTEDEIPNDNALTLLTQEEYIAYKNARLQEQTAQ